MIFNEIKAFDIFINLNCNIVNWNIIKSKKNGPYLENSSYNKNNISINLLKFLQNAQ